MDWKKENNLLVTLLTRWLEKNLPSGTHKQRNKLDEQNFIVFDLINIFCDDNCQYRKIQNTQIAKMDKLMRVVFDHKTEKNKTINFP